MQALIYTLNEGIWYNGFFVIVCLKCLRPQEAGLAFKEIHEGICGQHLGGKGLAHKSQVEDCLHNRFQDEMNETLSSERTQKHTDPEWTKAMHGHDSNIPTNRA